MTRALRLLLIISLTLNGFVLIGIGVAAYQRNAARQAVKSERMTLNDAYYRSRLTHFASFTGRAEIMFVGDSLTDFCEWHELLGRPGAANRGISGDTIEGVMARIDEVARQRPRKLFLLIGSNNYLRGDRPERVIPAYRALVARLRAALPGTTIFLLSIPPTITMRMAIPPAYINELNRVIASHVDGRGIQFIDIHRELVDTKGELDERYTVDGGHLNGAGYQAVRRVLSPHLD